VAQALSELRGEVPWTLAQWCRANGVALPQQMQQPWASQQPAGQQAAPGQIDMQQLGQWAALSPGRAAPWSHWQR